MADRFDPYYTWLGIPPEEQPANHYRLLGLQAFEANPEVISHAADQRMAHLKSLQGGKNAAASQRLLNELSAAVVCLLDPEKKRAYDQQLEQSLRNQLPQKQPPVAEPLMSTAGQAVGGSVELMPAISTTTKRRRSGGKGPLLVIVAGVGVAAAIAVIAVGLWLLNDHGPQVAQAPVTQPEVNNVQPAPPVPPGPPQPPPASTAVAPPSPQSPMPPTTESPPASPTTLPPTAAVAEVPATTSSSPLPSETTTPPVEPPFVEPPPAAAPPATSAEPRPPRSLADLVEQPASAAGNIPAVELPPPEALEKARTQVVEVLGEEAKQATKPELKTALAQKMLGLAKETVGDAATKYVLLDNARKLFIGAGEVRQATRAAATMSQHFKLDADALNTSTFAALADANLTAEDRDHLAMEILESSDVALDEQKFAIAEEYSLLATRVSSRTKDPELRKAIADRRTEMQRLKAQLKAVEEARAILAANAKDEAANLAVGKFLCFTLDNWNEGTPHLLKSGNADYVAAAEADARAVKGEKDAALSAADAWYKLAETVKKEDKDVAAGASGRAKELYERAIPSLSGLDKIRIEKRLEELQTTPEKPAARSARKKYFPGLVGHAYPKHESQADGNLYVGWVPPEELGAPIGSPAPIASLAPLKYSKDCNSVVRGYLRIDTAGEYAFNANADYDRCALYINGELVCPFRDGEQKVAKVTLAKGMVPIQVASMVVYSSQCTIKWQPPGAADLAPIPPTAMFHTRDLLDASKGTDFSKATASPSQAGSEAKSPGVSKLPAAKGKAARPALVIHNTHNSIHRDRGTTLFNVALLKKGKVVERALGVRLAWSPDQTPSVSLPLKTANVDTVRIEIIGWPTGLAGGGLSEVQLIANGENLLAGKSATASEPHDPANTARFSPATLTDGVIGAENAEGAGEDGYWILPNNKVGWVELKVAD